MARVRIPSGSRPTSQRLSYLGVSLTIRNSEVSPPLHSERICKAVAELGPGLSFPLLYPELLLIKFFFLLSLYLSLYARSLNQPYTSTIAKESQGIEKRNPNTTVEKEPPFSILLFSLK